MQQTTTAVLRRRGYTEEAAIGRFFEPKLAHLTPPEAMKDRALASERIARAVRAREKICVFGDYDADGITSAALLTDVLRALGADVRPLIADRFDGGYGLSAEALVRVFATGATLLITCDCGTSDHPRLRDAQKRGLDVVVIDHHRVPDEPLPALAFLNPHRPECGFAYKGLASVGLACPSARRCGRRSRPRSTCATGSTWSRWAPSPTSHRSTETTARSCGSGSACSPTGFAPASAPSPRWPR